MAIGKPTHVNTAMNTANGAIKQRARLLGPKSSKKTPTEADNKLRNNQNSRLRKKPSRRFMVRDARLADRNQRHALVLVVPSDALRTRVEREDAIHEEGVAVMPVLEIHVDQPRAIRHLLHGMRMRIPLVEIPHQSHRLGLGRVADEIHGAQVEL